MQKLLSNKTLLIFYSLCSVYLIGFLTVLARIDTFILYCLIPGVILLLLLAFFSFDAFVLSIVFFTPLAVTIKELGVNSDVDLSIPTEPFMAGVLLLLPIYQFYGKIIDKKVLTHPVTIVIFLQVIWMALTCFTSVMPLVSVKYLIARLWFLASAYFMMSYLFKKKESNVFKYLWLYIIPLTAVSAYITVQHAAYNFDEHIADWIPSPFYNDHTAYGAALAMYVPPLIGLLFMKRYNPLQKTILAICLAVILTGVVFSYARAAWLSLMIAIALTLVLYLKIKFRTIVFTAVTAGVLFFVFQTQIILLLNQNNTASGGDASQDLASVSNIKTDDSNLERINRWSCALKMFQQKPVFGWGPGTYMFQYAPFQKNSERSLISTNSGTNGNAHSEYLGPLSEQGVLGIVWVAALLLTVLNTGFRVVYNTKNKTERTLAILLLTGLITYFVHGFLNNFLDTDKLSIPFWGFIAALVYLDNKQKEDNQNQLEEVPNSL
ncbi:MAG TPA: O-antigen ligase family protein [Bacteroidia bacterium]|nr:O-antigen ligase family protein [Bacteroidia bacterium]